ncbi:MAG: C-GCAxxG-C-C family protein [Sarcina sp.]
MKTNIDINKIKEIAEKYYREGDFFCSEAVVKTIRDEFELDLPDEVIAMASGFPVGIGRAGCTCGAVTGGIMALGMVFGRIEAKDSKVNKTLELSKEIHDDFKERNRSLCCRILTKGMVLGTPEHKKQCVRFTGEVTEKVAEIIIREINK